MPADLGVLLMAYGTAASAAPADVEAYYTHIRRGRPPGLEQLDDLCRRYDAIGGASPLLERTRAQVAGLQAALGPDSGFTVVLGQKHAPPFIEDGVRELADAGVEGAVAMVLAPHYSALSVGEYLKRAQAAATEVGLTLVPVRSWHLEPGLIDLLAARVTAALARMPDDSQVIFTAHSLPERILEMGDPYPAQLAQTAAAVAERVGLSQWSTGWQSAGRTSEPWLGPDIVKVVQAMGAGSTAGLVVCPAGFVSDHLEVLYDLDIEAAQVAAKVGLPFTRTASLNDDPALCATLAEVVRCHAADSLGQLRRDLSLEAR